jgi:hypothetical protein
MRLVDTVQLLKSLKRPGHAYKKTCASLDDVIAQLEQSLNDHGYCWLLVLCTCCRSVLGIINHDGCMAEWVVLPARNLLPVPASLPDNLAVFCEPLAAACRILEQGLLLQDGSQQVAVVGGWERSASSVYKRSRLPIHKLCADEMRFEGCALAAAGTASYAEN